MPWCGSGTRRAKSPRGAPEDVNGYEYVHVDVNVDVDVDVDVYRERGRELQIQRAVPNNTVGGFDSHAPPPFTTYRLTTIRRFRAGFRIYKGLPNRG
jgi:hypothetical protein